MNMKQILNDPELSAELDKAYELAAPYRMQVQYKRACFNACMTSFNGRFQVIRWSQLIYGLYPGYVIIDALTGYAHPDFLV